MLLSLGQRPLSVIPNVYRIGLLLVSVSLMVGSSLGSLILSSVLGGRGSVEAWYISSLVLRRFLLVLLTLMFISLQLMSLSPLTLLIEVSSIWF